MSDRKILSFDEFIQPDATEYDLVQLPAGDFRIGSITAEDWVQWTEMRAAADGRKTSAAWLIARSMVDGDGNRIGNVARCGEIVKKNLKTSELILKAVFKLNGINQPKEEVAAKNG